MNAVVIPFPRSRVLAADVTDEAQVERRARFAARYAGANHAQAEAAAAHAIKRLRAGDNAHIAIQSAASLVRAMLRPTDPPGAA